MSKQVQKQPEPIQAKTAKPEVKVQETAVSSPITTLQRAHTDPNTLTTADAKTLQRTIGNQALRQLTIQRKITVGPVGDAYEQEADAMAKQVVHRMHTTQSAPAQTTQRQEEEDEVQMKPLPAISTLQRQEEEEEALQMQTAVVGAQGGDVNTDLEQSIQNARGGGQTMPAPVRAPLEQAFNSDFSQVKIHTDNTSDGLNRSLSARAFTTGRDIFFRSGEYNPGSTAGQELLAHELTHTVQQGAVSVQRRTPDTICRCPACTAAADDVTIQSQSITAIQRQENDHHHGCNCGSCLTLQRQTDIKTVMRHHEEERVQTKTIATTRKTSSSVSAIPVEHKSSGPVIQRHNAFEHYLLGQVTPSKLDGIPMVRQMPELEKEYRRLREIKRKFQVDPVQLPAIEAKLLAARARIDDVRHTLEQEMDRLLIWKDNPEAMSTRLGEKGKVTKAKDDTWQIPIVVLPCRDGEIVVSYSEMNTMPDLFGSPEAIADTPKANVLGLLQGVRQQSYIELDNMYKEIFGVSRSVLKNDFWIDDDFQGALGPRAQAVVDKAYEIRTESQVNTATTRQGEEHEQYFAALERNACHFAPESWTQWEGYHRKARQLATEATAKRQAAALRRQAEDEEGAKALEAEANDKANQAMIQNSFGEHYLQDSFASGHLIDKTKIMQWFMAWLNKNDDDLGTFAKAKGEWSMISTLSEQNLKSNPQALHDKMRRNELGSTEDATAELGMETKPEIVFLMWWRDTAAGDSNLKDMNATDAAAKFQLRGDFKLRTNKMKAGQILKKLADQGFADVGTLNFFRSEPLYTIKQVHIDSLTGDGAYDAKQAKTMRQSQIEHGTERDFVKEAHEFNLAAYNAFMSNAYVQASTKFFHDKFCKQGLTVNARNGAVIGKIYGDNNMLRSGGQAGVRFSAETSAMSRESIFNMVNETGADIPSVEAISGRFPGFVVVNGVSTSLVNWNENLKAQGEAGLFKEAKDNGALAVYKSQGGISDKGALDMQQLTQNIGAFTPHDDTPF